MKRKLIAALLTLCMVFSILPVAAFAAGTYEQPAALEGFKVVEAGVAKGEDLPEGMTGDTGKLYMYTKLNNKVPAGYTLLMAVFTADNTKSPIMTAYAENSETNSVYFPVSQLNQWYWGEEDTNHNAEDLSPFGNPSELKFQVNIIATASIAAKEFLPHNSVTTTGGSTGLQYVDIDVANPIQPEVPSSALTFNAVPAQTDLYGKKPADLGEFTFAALDHATKTVKVTGSAAYISGWTAFNGTEVEEQAGHYLPIQITLPEKDTYDPETDKLTVIGSKTKEVTGFTKEDHGVELVMRLDELTANKFSVTYNGEQYTVDCSGVAQLPEGGSEVPSISNVTLITVANKAEYDAKLTDAEKALAPWDSSRPEADVEADTDFPWLVVRYNRAKGGEVTFTFTKDGEPVKSVVGNTFTAGAANATATSMFALTKFTNAAGTASASYLYDTGKTEYGTFKVSVALDDGTPVECTEGVTIRKPVAPEDAVVTITTADLHDTSDRVADSDLCTAYSVAQPDKDNKITVSASDVRLHKNADTTPAYGYWTGVKFSAPAGYTVKYKGLDGDKSADWAKDVESGEFVALYNDYETKATRTIEIGLFQNDKLVPDSSKTYTIDFSGVTKKAATATVNYSALADTTIVADCAPETMWVQFDEPVNPSGNLWFDITAPDGTVYGIAASAQELASTGKLPTKQAWSFQNKGQFDAWPKNAEGEDVAPGVQNGDYTVVAYITKGTAVPTEKPAAGNLTKLFEQKVAVIAAPEDVEIAPPAAPTVDITGIAEADKETVENALKNVAPANSAGNVTLQNAAIESASETSTKPAYSEDSANAALKKAGLAEGTEQAPVKIIYQPYLEVKATAYDGSTKTLTVDITPKCHVLATTEASTSDLVFGAANGNNAVKLGEENLTVTKSIELQIGLPKDFVAKNAETYPAVYVQHKGYEYTAAISEVLDEAEVVGLLATFTNPHGFSAFTVTVNSAAVAKIGAQSYTSLKDAIEAAASGDVITVLKKLEGADATISVSLDTAKTLTFKVEDEAVAVELSINGTKVTPTLEGKEVTLAKTTGGSSSGGSSSGGKKDEETPTNPTQFVDVPAGAYYVDAVKWAVEKGITTGMTETTFAPNGDCSRAQMVTFLWRAAGSPKAEGANPFTDVAAGAYYYDAVLWAVSKGITNGTSATTFAPDDIVSRAQTVTFLYRYAGSPEASGNSFTDVVAGSYYEAAVDWAVAEGVTQGTSESTFSPDATCVRAQTVTFLYRYMVK